MEASDLQRMDTQDPEAGLRRPQTLWAVLGGEAGREEEMMIEHFPSLGPAGGLGQVWPHVGTLSAFCTYSGLVLRYPAGPQRGGSRPCQGKGGTTREPRGDHPPKTVGASQNSPLLPAQKAQVCATVYPRGAPPFLSQGLQEPRGEGGGLRSKSTGQRTEEVQAVPGVKVSWFP